MKLRISLFVVLLLSAVGFAKYSGGTGEPNDPYRIATPNDLNSIGLDPCDWDKHFLMTADINMSGITGDQYNIIGDDIEHPFSGVFDGNDHIISNFTCEKIHADHVGVFGVFSNGIIKNCQVLDCNILGNLNVGGLVGNCLNGQIKHCRISGDIKGQRDYIGGLVGENKGTINNCSSENGTIESLGGMKYVGGLAGCNSQQGLISESFSNNIVIGNNDSGGLVGGNISIITDCYSLSSINANSHVGGLVGINWGSVSNSYSVGSVTGGDGEVGGLVGYNDYNAEIISCYSSSDVIGGNDEGVGGLVGINSGSVSECFAMGDVSGVIDVAGLVGYNYTGSSVTDSYAQGDVNATCCYAAGLVSGNDGTVQRCYSTGKVIINGNPGAGLISHNHNSATDSFWDIETSDCNTSDAGTGLNTAQMQMRDTFTDAGWDMLNVWDIGENQTYPFLRTHLPSDINKDDQTNFLDLAILAQNWLKEE